MCYLDCMSYIKPASFVAPDKMEEAIRHLVQSNEEATRRHEEALRDQRQLNSLLAQQLATMQESMRVLQQQTVPGGTAILPAARDKVRSALRKMGPEDDIEAFSMVFERTAEQERLPAEQWAEVVAPFLVGDAQKAYFDLSQEEAKSYERLKGEVLARLGVNTYVRAHRVYQWAFSESRPARSQAYDLLHLVKKWLQPETLSPSQMVERVVVDRLVRTLPRAIQRWVGQGDPGTLEQVVGLVERYMATQDLVRDSAFLQKPRSLSLPQRGPEKGAQPLKGGEVISTPGRPNLGRRETPGIRCWHCQGLGHVAANCPRAAEPMDCGFARRSSFFGQPVCVAASLLYPLIHLLCVPSLLMDTQLRHCWTRGA